MMSIEGIRYVVSGRTIVSDACETIYWSKNPRFTITSVHRYTKNGNTTFIGWNFSTQSPGCVFIEIVFIEIVYPYIILMQRLTTQ